MVGIGTGNVFDDGAELSGEQLRVELRGYMDAHNRSQTDVARALDLSAPALSQWLRGVYKGDVPGIDRKVARFLGLEAQRADTGVVALGQFRETSVAEAVFAVCEYVQKHRSIGVVVGEAGMGKTMALKEYASRAPEALYLRCTTAHGSPSALLATLGQKLRMPEMSLGLGLARLLDRMLARLTGSGRMLILDEAQLLSIKAIETLRALHDEADVAMVWAGNGDVYRRVGVGSGRAEFAQIYSRVAFYQDVPLGATPTDVAKLVGQVPDAVLRYLVDWTHEPGGIRQMMKIYALARDLVVAGEGREVTLAHVKQAVAVLGLQKRRRRAAA